MNWEDVKDRSGAWGGLNQGVDALVQGRADVALHAIDWAESERGRCRNWRAPTSRDCSPQGEKRLRAAVPGYYPYWFKRRGQASAIAKDTCVNAYDIYFSTTHKASPAKVINAILKNIWDNVDKLAPLHPGFKDWTRQRAVDADVTISYHPAALQFYKERAAWTASMDDAQRRLLGLNP